MTPHAQLFEVPGAARGDSASPVVLPGATLHHLLRSPEFQVLEWTWNAEPNEAWYDPARSPSNPTQFEIGSKKVPQQSSVIILDFSVEPYRFSSVGSHESQPVTANSLRGSLAYAFTVGGNTPGSLELYLDPKSSIVEPEEFLQDKAQLWMNGRGKAADFAKVRASRFGAAAGYGTTLLPQRTGRYGATNAPFAVVATDDQVVTLRGVIYRPLSVPLASIEGSVKGYIGPTSLVMKHVRSMEGRG